jgi:septal ring factor EnvC (AmiA/AmiB activator)
MSHRAHWSAAVALICIVAGCSQDASPSDALTKELADSREEVTTLKAELLRTTKQLHETQAKIGESETKMFAAAKGKEEAQAQVAEITAEKAKISEQLQDVIKAQQDELTKEERAYSRLSASDRARVMPVLERAMRGEKLTREMAKILEDAHVGSKYVKKFLRDSLSDRERKALKGSDE